MIKKINKVFGKREKNKTYIDREGVYIIAEKDGYVATVKTPRGYFLPGGGIEKNESHLDCIKRECLEEIGYDVVIADYLCSAEIFTVHDRLGYFHPIQHYYWGKLVSKVTEPVETTHSFEWLTLSEATEKMYVQAQKWAVKKYFSDRIL